MFGRLRNWLAPAHDLTEEDVERGLRTLIITGVLAQVFVTFTGGVFLVALALSLGASNFVVGLLAAVGPLAQLLQLPSVFLVEKVRNRRLLSIISSGASRLTWFGIALIPILLDGQARLALLVFLMMLQSALGALSGASWNSWMSDLVPQDRLGSFFSRRMLIMGAVAALLSPLAGFFVDWWGATYGGKPLYAFSWLFAVGALVGLAGLIPMARVPEPLMGESAEPFHFFRTLRKPFGDRNFRHLIVYQGVWNFAVNLAAPFFTVYMLQRLSFSMSMVIILSTLSQIVNLFFLPTWGRLSDRFSSKAVLKAATPVFLFGILGWTFATLPDRHALTVPLLVVIHVVSGMASAGIGLATNNIGYKLAPRAEAAPYLGVMSVTNSLAAGIAPIVGGRTADFFTRRELSLTVNYNRPGQDFAFEAFGLEGWDFFFFFTFLLGLYALHRLAFVREPSGEIEEDVALREVISQTRREMRTLSTVGGLRRMMVFPIGLLHHLRRGMGFGRPRSQGSRPGGG